jgi:DNA polymerase delta subunit 1
MRWKDLCYSTHASLLTPEEIEMYENNEDVTVQRFKIDDTHQQVFIRNNTRSGILAQIETRLGLARKATRKLMVGETDKFVLALLDGKQLSEKLVMNALYGFCGASMGMLPMKAIAATITCIGRDTIMLTKNHLENNHDCQVVYGGKPSEYQIFKMKCYTNTLLFHCRHGLRHGPLQPNGNIREADAGSVRAGSHGLQ